MNSLNISTSQINKLPCIPLSHKDLMPDEPGIYFCFGLFKEEKKILYIGKAQNLRKRWSGISHHHYRDFQVIQAIGVKVCLSWIPIFAEESYISEIELRLINEMKPPLNNLQLHQGSINRKTIPSRNNRSNSKVIDIKNKANNENAAKNHAISKISLIIPHDWQPTDPGSVTPQLRDIIISCKKAGISQNQTLKALWPNISKSSGGNYRKNVQVYRMILREAGLIAIA